MSSTKLARVVGLLLLTLPFMACVPEEAEEARVAVAKPVKTLVVGDVEGASTRKFPARIEAARQAELGFRVAGSISDILVKESDAVIAGQVLARLDPTELELILDDRQAVYENAERNLQRGQDLIDEGYISRTDFDRMEANYRSAEAALNIAMQNLANTELVAPFAGRIARRLIDNFEEVSAKQTIFTLQQVNAFDVVIDVPESLLRTYRISSEDMRVEDSAVDEKESAWVTFEDVPGERFPLVLKEAKTTADPQTQTFAVTYTMPNPGTFVVLPGMTAEVTVDISRMDQGGGAHWVPASAVVADADLDPSVWVLDPESMRVHRVPVEVGQMRGDELEVRTGLAEGAEIVVVGAAYLAEDMAVSRMVAREQAVPRPGDPK